MGGLPWRHMQKTGKSQSTGRQQTAESEKLSELAWWKSGITSSEASAAKSTDISKHENAHISAQGVANREGRCTK